MDSFCFLLDLTSTYIICVQVFGFFLGPYSRDILNGCSNGKTPVLVLTVMWTRNALNASGLRICCCSLILWHSLHGFCIKWDGRLSVNGFPSGKPTLPFLGDAPPPAGMFSVLTMLGFWLWPFACSSCSCQTLGQACSSLLRSLGGGSEGIPRN